MIENLILHITLPKGLALTTGASLQAPVTFDVISALDPFYASVDEVKLAGGPTMRKLQETTIAAEIYQASKQVDLIQRHAPAGGDDLFRFLGARNQWVQVIAARQLLLNISTLSGQPGSHVLANFSVTRQKGFESEGVPQLLKDLKQSAKDYDIVIRSKGRYAPGGHVLPAMAAKGVFDWQESTPGRQWATTGMGANRQSGDGVSNTGGRGKTVSYYTNPMFAGPMSGFRFGSWQSGLSIQSGFPGFATTPLSYPLL